MRGTRWLLLVAIAVILTGIAITYRAQKKVIEAGAPPTPALMRGIPIRGTLAGHLFA